MPHPSTRLHPAFASASRPSADVTRSHAVHWSALQLGYLIPPLHPNVQWRLNRLTEVVQTVRLLRFSVPVAVIWVCKLPLL